MSGIIEGYNYDIFISYRQKDNKGEKWVSEFVESLKTELESTFQDEISDYFDINPHDGSHIWSERYDREIKDVFAIQDEISHSITETLKIKLSDDRNLIIIKHKTGNLDAYNFYLKGNYYSRMLTQGGFRKATEYYEKALAIDTYYALPYVGLAEVMGFRTYWGNYKPS